MHTLMPPSKAHKQLSRSKMGVSAQLRQATQAGAASLPRLPVVSNLTAAPSTLRCSESPTIRFFSTLVAHRWLNAQANFRFLVSDTVDLRRYAGDADLMLDWDDVLQVFGCCVALLALTGNTGAPMLQTCALAKSRRIITKTRQQRHRS